MCCPFENVCIEHSRTLIAKGSVIVKFSHFQIKFVIFLNFHDFPLNIFGNTGPHLNLVFSPKITHSHQSSTFLQTLSHLPKVILRFNSKHLIKIQNVIKQRVNRSVFRKPPKQFRQIWCGNNNNEKPTYKATCMVACLCVCHAFIGPMIRGTLIYFPAEQISLNKAILMLISSSHVQMLSFDQLSK